MNAKVLSVKNTIGAIVFALIGVLMESIAIYPHAVESFSLTDTPNIKWTFSDVMLILGGFVFVFGSFKFKKMVDSILDFLQTTVKKYVRTK